MTRLRHAFLDLDGTLVGPSGQVDDALWPRLDALRERGVGLSVCTGRPSGGVASAVAARLDPTQPHIFHGGGVVRRVTLDAAEATRVVDEAPMRAAAIPRESVRALVAVARQRQLTLELYTADRVVVERMTAAAAAHAELLGRPTDVADLAVLAEEHDVVKAQWVVDAASGVGADLAAEVPARVHAARASSPVMPGTEFVTLTRDDAHKGDAIRWLAAELAVDLVATAGVGDTRGDLPMLEVVAHPYVVACERPAWAGSLPVVSETSQALDAILELCA